MDWLYTPATEDIEAPMPHSTVEVHRDAEGHYWLGLSHYTDPRDWEFVPRAQYGRDEAALRIAKAAADAWSRELATDRRWTER